MIPALPRLSLAVEVIGFSEAFGDARHRDRVAVPDEYRCAGSLILSLREKRTPTNFETPCSSIVTP